MASSPPDVCQQEEPAETHSKQGAPLITHRTHCSTPSNHNPPPPRHPHLHLKGLNKH
jgi:hypothetical protein